LQIKWTAILESAKNVSTQKMLENAGSYRPSCPYYVRGIGPV